MALTVGELRAVLSFDDRAVDPALRRMEQAMRTSGGRVGDDADQAGQDAGERLGEGLVRGADGQWRTMRGELATAAQAAVAEAESIMRRGGRQIAAAAGAAGDQAGQQLGDGIADGADQGVEQAGGRLERLKTVAGGAALAAGAAAGALLVSSMQEALSQGQLVGKLQAQLGLTPAVAKRYGSIAGQLFKDGIVTNFEQGTQTMRAIAGSGLVPPEATNAQLKSIATHAADLASTFDVEVSEAAQAAGVAVKTGLAKDSTEAFDLISKGMVGLGKDSDDLLETVSQYGVQFAKSGLSGRTAFGLMRQAVQAGWKDTDKIADAFKELELRVTAGEKPQVEALQSIGLNAEEMITALSKGGAEGEAAMAEIHDSIVELGPGSQTAKKAIQELFGGPGEDLGAAFFKLNLHEAQKAMSGTAGETDKLGKALRGNAGANLTKFRNTLQQNLVEFLGGKVVPAMAKAFGWMQEHQGEIKFGAALITGLVVPALVLLGSKALWAGIQMARAWVMALGPIGIIGLAIGGLVILVIAYWDEVKHYTLAAWNWIVDKLKWAKDGILAAVAYLGTIPGKISAWFGQAKDWAVEKMVALVNWLRALPGRIGSALAAMLGVLRQRATSAFESFRNAAVQRAMALVTWVAGLPGRISRGIGSLSSLLTQKGRNVVQGLWSGISSMGGWIKSKLIGWAKSMIPGPIAKALGIASPSKVTKAQGQWIAKGLIDGLTGSSKQVRSAADKLSGIVRDALTGRREKAALKGIKKNTKWLAHQANVHARVSAQLKNAQKRLADLQKARTDLSVKVRDGIRSEADITKQDTGGWNQTAASILAGLKADTAAAQQFAKNLATLQKKGVRRDLIAQIAQAGVSGGASSAAALANASAKEIKAINHQQALLNGAAAQTGRTAGSAMYDAGIRAAQGLVKGLTSHQKYLERTMLSLAKYMSKGIRKALGIKSPSRVMAEVGRYTALGLVAGLEGQRSAVNKSMAGLVETPAPGSWDMASARARAAAAQRTVIEIRSSGKGVDNFLVEGMRRGVQKKGGGDVDFVFSGRRSR
ncbi:phage tail tape measure protein [Streptomyces griseoincarnatus]